ncbi:ATP-dependent helicase HrpB [Oceanicoccus sp. KOV_DT_Chl]|uniref:ATP-dependent helicase HrpB n=1 Tax=Oceanicoccus sp. KOV_DT_Chl TaxID=1904639 RepID=UPI001F158E5C|nr:ATP-dependent helicase HrpB [Oceanicoccus sp. KOV_DT_Chl]
MNRPTLPTLPISEVLPAIQQHLQQQHQLVLEAPPGAGKTTLVPLALLDQEWAQGQRIIMLEPRRMAARNAAHRMAELLGEKAGDTIGYRVRQDSKVSQHTRVEVITEGILTRLLMQDPALEGIAAIIFDEFHERSLDGDLGLALSLQSRELFRDAAQPLKLIVMSATLDGDAIAQLLGKDQTPIVRSHGKMYPVEIIYQQAKRFDDNVVERVTTTLLQAATEQRGSILTFLPGQGEIHLVMQQLTSRLTDNTVVLPLYGALSLAEQQQAIAPLADNSLRKIVLATDIAETSLTIEGITVVVDSGLCRQPNFDPATGMTRLRTNTISKDSSIQRMGRAGRLSAGVCYRLWSEEQQQQLAQQSPAEILQADLAPLALQLLSWGIDDIEELQWLDTPPAGPFNQALDLLAQLGAITTKTGPATRKLSHWQLSEHGQRMAILPTHPRLAHMLLCSVDYQLLDTACALAALLADRSPLSREFGGDLELHLAVVMGDTPCHSQHKAWLRRTQQQAKSFAQLSRSFKATATNTLPPQHAIGFLLACAYPDRIARRKTDNQQQYQLSNGRIAQINPAEALSSNEWLAVVELGGRIDSTGKSRHDTIYTGSAFDPLLLQNALQHLVSNKNNIEWQDDSDRFVAEQQQWLGKLIIQRKKSPSIDPDSKRLAVLALVQKRGLGLLPWTKKLQQWRARVNLIFQSEQQQNDKLWPDLSDQALLATLDQWLEPYLDPINKLADFKQLDLANILNALLPWPLPQQLDQLAPTHLRVPSGSNIEIDYSENPPLLKVKLQEMFGCTHTPTIANGKIKLKIHLLSPAQRPLQVTQDLEGFWQSSYVEIKKEMKGRYPKHPWPDDPLQALPTKLTKRRLAKE